MRNGNKIELILSNEVENITGLNLFTVGEIYFFHNGCKYFFINDVLLIVLLLNEGLLNVDGHVLVLFEGFLLHGGSQIAFNVKILEELLILFDVVDVGENHHFVENRAEMTSDFVKCDGVLKGPNDLVEPTR